MVWLVVQVAVMFSCFGPMAAHGRSWWGHTAEEAVYPFRAKMQPQEEVRVPVVLSRTHSLSPNILLLGLTSSKLSTSQ